MLLPDQTYEQVDNNSHDHDVEKLDDNYKRILHTTEFTVHDEKVNVIENVNQGKFETEENLTEEINELIDSTESETSEKRDDSPENFSKTSEFFNNIPEFCGEPLGPFTLKSKNDEPSVQTSPDILRECESFLGKYRIRPEFFCRYRRAME